MLPFEPYFSREMALFSCKRWLNFLHGYQHIIGLLQILILISCSRSLNISEYSIPPRNYSTSTLLHKMQNRRTKNSSQIHSAPPPSSQLFSPVVAKKTVVKRNSSLRTSLHPIVQLQNITRNPHPDGKEMSGVNISVGSLLEELLSGGHWASGSNNGTGNVDLKNITYSSSSSDLCRIRDSSNNGVRPLKIMVSTSKLYIPILLNWLQYFRKICRGTSGLYFMCLDRAAETGMQKVGLQCSYSQHTAGSKNHIWLMRVRITKQLLDQGFDVLMTDSDAIWVHNPFLDLQEHQQSDLIASRGSFPENASKHLGATLCMGFIYIKATVRTKALFGDLAVKMAGHHKPDDQRELNDMLLIKGLKYTPKATYVGSKSATTGSLMYGGSEMRVTLLPHDSYRRICEGHKVTDMHNATVVHCLSEKTGISKEKSLERIGLWSLRVDWKTLKNTANSSFIFNELSKTSVTKSRYLLSRNSSSFESAENRDTRYENQSSGFIIQRSPHEASTSSALLQNRQRLLIKEAAYRGSFQPIDTSTYSSEKTYCDPMYSMWNISIHSTDEHITNFETYISQKS